jgi:hypothetical protein
VSYDLPDNFPVQDAQNKVTLPWLQVFSRWKRLFASQQTTLDALQQSGTTANRPTTGLWRGRMYFDTTLNRPIWLAQVSPPVWINAFGVIV